MKLFIENDLSHMIRVRKCQPLQAIDLSFTSTRQLTTAGYQLRWDSSYVILYVLNRFQEIDRVIVIH
jgi:hypothetical protein